MPAIMHLWCLVAPSPALRIIYVCILLHDFGILSSIGMRFGIQLFWTFASADLFNKLCGTFYETFSSLKAFQISCIKSLATVLQLWVRTRHLDVTATMTAQHVTRCHTASHNVAAFLWHLSFRLKRNILIALWFSTPITRRDSPVGYRPSPY